MFGEMQILAQQSEVLRAIDGLGWWPVLGVIAALLVLLFVFDMFTRAGTIARATTKEAIRQPVFLLTLLIGISLTFLNTYIPFFSFNDDVKMLMDCGLATILISGLLLACWTSSTSVADEIEGKTAMTLLSKPINRRQFVLGKYIGILQSVALLMLPMACVLLACIYVKVGYDAREGGAEVPPAIFRVSKALLIVPGLLLIFLEIAILSAVSVAISTRLPMVVNIVTCLAIFVVGHLTVQLVESGAVRIEFVEFMARLIATVLPALEVFNMSASVATGKFVPPEYLGYAAAYCAAYCTAAILLAFILFEDRDLA